MIKLMSPATKNEAHETQEQDIVKDEENSNQKETCESDKLNYTNARNDDVEKREGNEERLMVEKENSIKAAEITNNEQEVGKRKDTMDGSSDIKSNSLLHPRKEGSEYNIHRLYRTLQRTQLMF